jgi:PAS domain S-box-containing protein
MRRLFNLVLVLCLFLPAPIGVVSAQEAQQSTSTPLQRALRFSHITSDDGLAQNSVFAILQDRRGFLWFGTQDGLSRFDGYRFTTYKHDPNNPNSLNSNFVISLFEDRDGMVWVGTRGVGGLNRFDPTTETFTRYSHRPDDPTTVGGNTVHAILQDRSGTLWVGGPPSSGMSRLPADAHQPAPQPGEPPNARFTRFYPDPQDSKGYQGAVWAFTEDQAGAVWVLTDGALLKYDPQSANPTVYKHPNPDERRLAALYQDAVGNFWVGGNTGLYKFDPRSGTFTLAPGSPGPIEVLTADDDGRLWVGTTVHGLALFDLRSERFVLHLRRDYADPNSLSDDQIEALYRDKAGLLWIGTVNGGLNVFDPRRLQFIHYRHNPSAPQGLAAGTLRALMGQGSNVAWVATDKVLNQLDLPKGQVSQVQLPTDHPGTWNITALFSDHAGHLWIGTNARLLYELDPTSGSFSDYALPALPPSPGPRPPAEITAIQMDEQGAVWVGVLRDGLYRLDPQTGQIQTYQASAPAGGPEGRGPNPGQAPPPAGGPAGHVPNAGQAPPPPAGGREGQGPPPDRPPPPAGGPQGRAPNPNGGPPPAGGPERQAPNLGGTNPDTIANAMVSTFAYDQAGMLWIGYEGGALSRLDTDTGKFQHYQPDLSQPETSLGGSVYDIHIAPDGLLWLATRLGLVRFDPATGQIKRYNEDAGLPTSFLTSILAEPNGRLWLGSKRGLVRFDPATETVRSYDALDGVQSNDFSAQVAWRAGDGQMFFGGTNGLTAFYPDQVRDDSSPPPVVLTELRLFNKPELVGTSQLLPHPLWATEQLTLNYDQDVLSFEFAALSYAAPNKNRYRYKLEGYEANWNEVDSSRRFANYTSLPAGDYTLRVQGSNGAGVWNEEGAALRLTILPPWWETTWFRASALLGFLALLYAGHRWRLYAIERRNQLLEQQVTERTRDLAESEARFRGLATSAFEAVLVHDQGRILDLNQAAVDLFGYQQADLLGKQLSDLLTAESQTILASQPSERAEAFEVLGLTRQGTTIPLEIRDRVVPFQGRNVQVAAIRDLTQRQQIEAQKGRLAVLTERERIGRELHDDLGQVIGFVNVQSQAILAFLAQGNSERAQASLGKLVSVAQRAHEDVRQYINGFRSGDEPPPDFLAALESHLEQLERHYGLKTEVSWPDDLLDNPLTPDVGRQLLRIIQEALNNVRKHAGVSSARLLFAIHPTELEVTIADDGPGLAHPQTAGQTAGHENGNGQAGVAQPGHYGLQIMRERAEMVGGALEVRSAPGQGTQVMVRVPRAAEAQPPVEAERLRVLLVDDHQLYLEGLQTILSSQGIEVIGLAHDGLEAQELARSLRPNLILMDVQMPNCNGIEATRRIKAEQPEVKIVILTVSAEEELLLDALKYGASGYLLKNLDGSQLFSMLNDVMRGEVVLSPTLAARVMTEFKEPTGKAALVEEEQEETLTIRQYEVLRLAAQGRSNKEIAGALHVSENTVKYHIRQILERLQLRSRHELAHYVRRQGLVAGNQANQ